MKQPIRIIKIRDNNEVDIRFWPTDICNYDCSYCFPNSHPGKFRYPKDTQLVIDNFRKLFDSYQDTTQFRLTISGGGEPTLWPDLELFCKEIKETHNVNISLVSNGSRTVRWWKNNCKYFDSVSLSFHHEFADLDHYIEVADTLFAENLKVTAMVLMDASSWDKCADAVTAMQASTHNWHIQTKEMVDAPGKDINSYTQEQLDYVKDSVKRIPDSDWLLKRIDDYRLHESAVMFDDDSVELAKHHTILVNKWNNFQNWNCDVGRESLVITGNGDIKGSCGVPVFKTPLNIYKNFEISSHCDVVCPYKSCNCQPDTHISKKKS